MSGYAYANTERARAASCLRKPFTPNALLTSVNECLTKQGTFGRASKN